MLNCNMLYKCEFVTIVIINCFSLTRTNLRRKDGGARDVSTNKLKGSIKISGPLEFNFDGQSFLPLHF